ncbi:MAG: FAD-dependent oxidoreductase [Acidimicrobiales bacterium]
MPYPSVLDTDVCLLGAGPHALAAAVHLRRARPGLRLITVDPSGAWLTTWHDQMARAEITTLRSPVVHHPSPDPAGLAHHVRAHRLASSGLPYEVPTTEAFTSFCTELIEGYGLDAPVAARTRSIVPGPRPRIEAGRYEIHADRVVVATNPHRRVVPDWVWPLLGRRSGLFAHAAELDLARLPDLDGERVVVVGGGLSAAHLACGAVRHGARVQLVTRRPLQVRNFDTDPGWLGPRCLRAFDADPDPAGRLRRAREARGGGSVPPWMHDRLDELVARGDLTIRDPSPVRTASVEPGGSCRLALADHTTVIADRVWLATGTAPDISAARYLEPLVADQPVVGGLPVVGDDLRLGSFPVYVMGRLATLTLGPAAGNLWGAQRAARRITYAVTGVDLGVDTLAAPPPPPPRAAPHPASHLVRPAPGDPPAGPDEAVMTDAASRH